MRKLATVMLLVALVAQVATGSRLVHFCPTAIAAVAEAASSLESHHDDDHGHLHFGPGGHHHDHCHAHGKKRSSTVEQSTSRRVAPAFPALMQEDSERALTDSAQYPDSRTPDRHDCAIFSAAKLFSVSGFALTTTSADTAADFALLPPGITGWYVTVDEVTCAQWPRPPTPDPSPPRSLERLAFLCRFLL